MKRIVLVRHAKVDIDDSIAIYANQLQTWIERYDSADIEPNSKPTKELIEIVKGADVVVTSTLKRTDDSAKLLGVVPKEKNEIFDEVAIPNLKMPFFRFTLKTWLIILRVLLLFRIKIDGISLSDASNRAKVASKYLISLTYEYDTVVLIGHGGMNWLMKKALLKDGWKLEGKASFKNFGTIKLKKV